MILPGCELSAPSSNLAWQRNSNWWHEKRRLATELEGKDYVPVYRIIIVILFYKLHYSLCYCSFLFEAILPEAFSEKSVVMEGLNSSITRSNFYIPLFAMPKSLGKYETVDFRNRSKIYRSHCSSQKTPQIMHTKPENWPFGWMQGPQYLVYVTDI